MRAFLKKAVSALPKSDWIFSIYRNAKLRIYYGVFKGKEQLFSDYYKVNNWGDEESGSGYGSTLSYTEVLRERLPELFQELNVKSVLDAPCGDLNWFKHILDKPTFKYIGGDIVPSLIKQHNENLAKENVSFIHLDVTEDELPSADLWLCRDCLIHFSNKDIIKTLNHYLESDIPYLLTTSYTESEENRNIATGAHRFLNLTLPPFNFPEPKLYINDWVEGYPVKKLGLWEKEQIADTIRNLTSK